MMPAAGSSVSTAREVFGWACLLLDLSFASYLLIGFFRRERPGRILLDLGRIDENHSTRLIVWGGFWILFGFVGVLFSGSRDFRWTYFTFFMLQGVNSIVMGMQRFLICEAGILSSEPMGRHSLLRPRKGKAAVKAAGQEPPG